MLLVYTHKITPRIKYTFKQVCTRILGIPVDFTTTIEDFIAHDSLKMSYAKQPLSSEVFIRSNDLLFEQGLSDLDINIYDWEDTKCFFPTGEKSALPFDIFAATFYLISRYEEYLPHVKDELGRFPATESLAYKEGFLKQPVVDVWAHQFKEILLETFPQMEFPHKQLTIHNVIEAKRPFEFLQRGVLRNILGFGGDLWKLKLGRFFLRIRVLLHLRKDPYDTFSWMLNNVRNSASKLTIFFLLGEAFSYREDFNTKRQTFKSLVKYVADYCEVGLMFSFYSVEEYEKLKVERFQMEDITHRTLQSSTNDRQLVNLPLVYRNLVELEIKNDFTMFYYNEIGFRAGTCTPFLFYDLDYEVKTPLVLQPVIGKSLALTLGKEKDTEGTIMQVYNWVKQVNGTFIFFFSNRDFERRRENKTWRYLFSEKLNPNA